MRKLVASTSVSLDGVMQAPGGPEEDPTAAFALGGWAFPAFPYWAETLDLTDLAERGFEVGSRVSQHAEILGTKRKLAPGT
jgi:hypothetical protein